MSDGHYGKAVVYMERIVAETKETSFSEKPSDEAARPANDENPKHREDFTRLLGAAVRKPPQED